MQSLTYVFAAYGVGFFLLSACVVKILVQRLQLRSIIMSLEAQNESED